MSEENYFKTLNSIDVGDKVEKKNGLSYLSWAWAWGEVKKYDPSANYVIYERPTDFGPVNYFTDGKTCWVKTGVIIRGIEHVEELPVMDYRNQSILLDKITSFDVNKTIQRSLTKAVARHGLGLYIYAGEDLPEDAVVPATTGKSPKGAIEDKIPEVKTIKKNLPVPATRESNEENSFDSTTPNSGTISSSIPAGEGSVSMPSLLELKEQIGAKVRMIGTATGSLASYKQVVKEITGTDDFKVNSATDEQYDTVLAIAKRLSAIEV